MMETAEMAVQQALGTLTWDLPARKEYSPNTVLPFTLRVGNPTSGVRGYALQAQVLIGEQLVWYADLLVDGQQWFQVAAGSTLTIQGQFQADRSDFTFRVLLIDQATNQAAAQVQAELYSPSAPTPTPDSTGMLEQLLPMLSLFLVMGLLTSTMGVFRRQE